MNISRYIAITILLLLGFCKESFGQQLPQYSQYMLNNYLINPAVAGTYRYVNLKMSYRYQWLGFSPNVPQTGSVSIYGPVRDKNMGWGGSAYIDVTGPVSRQEILGTYAYNFNITGKYHMSFAASLGVLQYRMDFSQITFSDKNEPLRYNSPRVTFEPDANTGIYFYSPDMYLGFSSHQLLGNKLDFYKAPDDSLANLKGVSRLVRHYYVTGGYKHSIGESLMGEAYLLVKGSRPVPVQWELSAKMTYQNRQENQEIWGGLSYRHNDAICVLLGGRIRKYGFGISYDVLTSSMSRFTTGSLEIMLSYRFNKPED